MAETTKTFFRSDLSALILLAAAFFLFHLATNHQYGFHRDELQTLDDARHLDWGFVAYPPITPLLARLELTLFGTSLVGFRVAAALAVSAVMVLTGLIAKELDGNRHIQLLAAFAVGVSPIALVQGAVLQYVSFDYLWGVAATYCLARLVNSDDPRWWLAIGTLLGLGMETRYTAGFLALGIAGAVLLTSLRRHLASKWLWMGVALSLLIFLPNVIWQARHHFISLEFLSYLRRRDARQGRYAGFYLEQLKICANLMATPLVLLGLWFYFFRQEAKRYRALGWVFVVTFALFAMFGARAYYTAPIYPLLIAGGSVQLGMVVANASALWRRVIYGAQWAALVFGGVLAILIVTPVAPFGSSVWKLSSRVHDEFREEIGWDDQARMVATVFNALPPEERSRTGILTGNYGEGGGLNVYGPALGLPHAMSLTNSFWYRGYDPRQPQTVILVGFDLDEAQELFDRCEVAATNGNARNVVNEESRDHPQILVCRNLKRTWSEYWARSRRFG